MFIPVYSLNKAASVSPVVCIYHLVVKHHFHFDVCHLGHTCFSYSCGLMPCCCCFLFLYFKLCHNQHFVSEVLPDLVCSLHASHNILRSSHSLKLWLLILVEWFKKLLNTFILTLIENVRRSRKELIRTWEERAAVCRESNCTQKASLIM